MTAAIIFVFTYVAFSVGRVPGLRSDRLAAAIVGAVLVVALRVLTVQEAQAAVDGASLGLLFGMMLLSAALDVSGTFALVGHAVTKRARSPLALLVLVSIASAVLSAFLINDVVCIAVTPLVLQVTRQLDRDARPYLLALATSSNIGSVATITGNPQNILIGSLSHVSYGHFALMLAPVAALSLVANVGIIWLLYRNELARPLASAASQPKPRSFRRWVWKSVIVTAAVLVGFAFGVPPVVCALVGASVMLITRAVEPRRLYARVDFPLLALFVGLFVVVAGVEKAGLAERALVLLRPLHPESVWGLTALTAVLSNVVSNVPAVMVLKSVMPGLPDPERAWLTLAMASTLAGNLTLPGSLATIIVVERAREQCKIGFLDFLKVGVPTGLTSLLIGAVWLRFV